MTQLHIGLQTKVKETKILRAKSSFQSLSSRNHHHFCFPSVSIPYASTLKTESYVDNKRKKNIR